MNFKSLIPAAALACGLFWTGCGGKDANPTEVKDSLSFAYGMMMGRDLAKNIAMDTSTKIDKAEFLAAFRSAVLADTSDELLISDKQAMDVIKNYTEQRRAEFEQKMRAEQESQEREAAKQLPEKKAAEDAWFAANVDNKKGIQKTPTGLRYEVIKAGKGDKPVINNTVTVHYHGTLTDGTVFDSSVERGQPATFPVGGVIPGWVEALQMMPVGSKWKLYIPFELGYGSRDMGEIGPFSTLIFEVELLQIKS